MNLDDEKKLNTTEARKLVKPLFAAEAFQKYGGIQAWFAPEVVVLVGFTSSYDYLFIDVGFWITGISSTVPVQAYKCHIYNRLERFYPELRPEIIDAGDCKNKDYKIFLETFRDCLHSTIAPGLKSLASEAALIERFIACPNGPAPMPAFVSSYLKSKIC
jgi:hypothetical protein